MSSLQVKIALDLLELYIIDGWEGHIIQSHSVLAHLRTYRKYMSKAQESKLRRLTGSSKDTSVESIIKELEAEVYGRGAVD